MWRRLFWLSLLIAVSGMTSAALGQLDPALVGWWSFDEGAGTVAYDGSGNGNDGTFVNDPHWEPGTIDGALGFDGDDNDQVELSTPLPIGSVSNTVAVWMKVPVIGQDNLASGERVGDVLGNYNDSPNSNWELHNAGQVRLWWNNGEIDARGSTDLRDDTWHHVAWVRDREAGACAMYIDGQLEASTTTIGSDIEFTTTHRIGGDNRGDPPAFHGLLDDLQIYSRALSQDEVVQIMDGLVDYRLAQLPLPGDEATDVPWDTSLNWTAGEWAATHDVYFGTSFDDVNEASRANPMGGLVSEGQSTTNYTPDDVLDFETTYYWRVDEVNAAPDNTIYKGDIWSFTVEPLAYPIADIIATSNVASENGAGPENTVNGSGLNDNDEHSNETEDMWQIIPAAGETPYIQYEFDRTYKLHELIVWNYNANAETLLGFSLKDVTIEYSEDGATWALLGNVTFNQGTGTADYPANTIIEFAGVAARYVRLTINSGYGAFGQYGLSEVRFLYIPAQAREPQPADGATGVSVATSLDWRAGREAVTHELSLGTDPNALTLVDATTATSYAPGTLDLGTTYYWKVDEVNEADAVSVWEGSLWSFATQDYIVIDDFEAYNDEDNVIYESWEDGWVNGTGSTAGYWEAPFAEMTIVHSGNQSMPLLYDNSSASTSEVDFTLNQDWTTSGIQSLSLHFHGNATNTGGELYIVIDGTKVAYDGDAADLIQPTWQAWNIDLSTVGINLSNITTLTIGIEGAGVSGTVYIDDVRLYPLTPELIVPVQPDDTNLVAHYTFDGDLNDSVGSHHGTAMGDAHVTSDAQRGQVLSLDGTDDGVEVAYSAALNPEAFTASVWANPDSAGTDYRSPITCRDDSPQRGYIMYLNPSNIWQFWTGNGSTWGTLSGPEAVLDEWTHLAATFADEQQAFYVNGRLVAEGSASLSPNTAQPLRIGAGATEGPGNYFFQGLLDDARLYNVALSAEEIAGLAGRTEPLHKPF